MWHTLSIIISLLSPYKGLCKRTVFKKNQNLGLTVGSQLWPLCTGQSAVFLPCLVFAKLFLLLRDFISVRSSSLVPLIGPNFQLLVKFLLSLVSYRTIIQSTINSALLLNQQHSPNLKREC